MKQLAVLFFSDDAAVEYEWLGVVALPGYEL